MFRAFRGPLLEKVRYASLFPHNIVLQAIFDAPPGNLALTVEVPGMPTVDYTYGRLQRDVIRLADLLVARREAVAGARGAAPLSWLQPRRPPHVRSVFAQGERTPSCTFLNDTGVYSAALLASPSYAFVVSLLSCWAVHQLATPLSAGLTGREWEEALRHSGARLLLGEVALLEGKLPPAQTPLHVRAARAVHRVSPASRLADSRAAPGLGFVETILDTPSLLAEFDLADEARMFAAGHAAGGPPFTPELLDPTPAATGGGMRTAEDVVDRLARAKAAARDAEDDRLEALLRDQHRAKHARPDADDGEADDPFCFDSDRLEGLNPVFRCWFTTPSSRPTPAEDCLMLYTSGTTARPKGAVHTHASVSNMIRILQEAWEWRREDVILHVLPLSHIHGLVNGLLCALASGARCVLTKFDHPARIAHRLERGDITLFMAVPAVYTRMIAAIQEGFSPIERTGFRKACGQAIRLMVSGSSALPSATLRQFRVLSGHLLLERYGMTEVGMALGQPLRPEQARVPGTVGSPFPTVRAAVLDPEREPHGTCRKEKANEKANANTREGIATETGGEGPRTEVGVLAIASASLFDRYWNNPAATMKELREDANGVRYFETGDTVRVQYPPAGEEKGTPPLFTIMGRTSVDIIKSNGYKLSALEIEAMMLLHDDLFYEVAVVGVQHEVKGEEVVAVVALQQGAAQARGIEYDSRTNTYESDQINTELREIVSNVLAPYKLPRRFICVPKIPRNDTGKVNKVALKLALNLQ